MSDNKPGQLKAFALALILVGMVALPLVRGFQTGFAPTADVIENVSHPAQPSISPEHKNKNDHKKQKPGKPERHDDDD